MDKAPLYIAKPLLPDITIFKEHLNEIWESGWVTNGGKYSQNLEDRLSKLLEVPTAMLFNNGTSGIIATLMSFNLPSGGEVITTPMTFAATAHAITAIGLKPVFVDIKKDDLTIDPAAVAEAITPNTVAIMGVHVYGFICDDKALRKIAEKHDLKLIYDAAHAFASRIDGVSCASLGNASIFSFHATKLFNTLEGGLVTTCHINDQQELYLRRNFGILNEDEVTCVGINGKMNEVQALIGLLNLDLFEQERAKRKILRQAYHTLLDDLIGIEVIKNKPNVKDSEQYFVIKVDSEQFGCTREKITEALAAEKIYARRYFHPICTDFTPYLENSIITTHEVPYASTVKKQVLCLPFHSDVTDAHLQMIGKIFRNLSRGNKVIGN